MASASDFTLLIVDDEKFLRETLAEYFHRFGFNTIAASSGDNAVEILDGKNIDLVISDVRMPNGDGLGISKHIHFNQDGQPPIIFVTGFADYSDDELTKFGASRVYKKPISSKILLDKVQELLAVEGSLPNSQKEAS